MLIISFFVGKTIELPWDEPTTGCSQFVKWKSDNSWVTITPWSKLETLALSLIRRILEPNSVKRITLDKLIEHKWCAVKSIDGKFCNLLYEFNHQLYVKTCKTAIQKTCDRNSLNMMMKCDVDVTRKHKRSIKIS